MGQQSKNLTKELYIKANEALKNLGDALIIALKLKAILLSEGSSITAAGKAYRVRRNTLALWIEAFIKDGAKGLLCKDGSGRKTNILEEHMQYIKHLIAQDCTVTIEKIRILLQQKFNCNTSRAAVHRAIQKLKFAYITPRPVHNKNDPIKVEDYKKKLKN